MNEFEEIRKKLDDYRLESYNPSKGWAKLQKRNRSKKRMLIRMVATAAAACLLIITGYWLRREDADDKSRSEVASLSIPAKKIPGIASPDTVTKSSGTVNESLQLSVVKGISNNLKSNRERRVMVIKELKSVRENTDDRYRQSIIEEKNATAENVRVTIVSKGSSNNKSLEMVSEEQLLAMMSVVKEVEPKQSKLKKFLISKSQQQEYAADKYSSDPGRISQINF